jgi:hypothetical protein
LPALGGLTRFGSGFGSPQKKTTGENGELPRNRINLGPRTRSPAGQNLNPPRTPPGLNPRGPDPNPPHCQAYLSPRVPSSGGTSLPSLVRVAVYLVSFVDFLVTKHLNQCRINTHHAWSPFILRMGAWPSSLHFAR